MQTILTDGLTVEYAPHLFDQEREQEERFLNDEVIEDMHETIMEMAKDWAAPKTFWAGYESWLQGKVCGAIMALHRYVLKRHTIKDADMVLDEYLAMVFPPRRGRE